MSKAALKTKQKKRIHYSASKKQTLQLYKETAKANVTTV